MRTLLTIPLKTEQSFQSEANKNIKKLQDKGNLSNISQPNM